MTMTPTTGDLGRWGSTIQWYDERQQTVATQIYAPAIRRLSDQELYDRAIAEHDQQEADRLSRIMLERRLASEQRADEQREREARRVSAHDKAKQLLLAHLSPAQQETFTKNGWFMVEGGKTKTRYRIRSNTLVANVDVLEHQRDDKITHRLCGHIPTQQVPLGDHLLAQKMMLEFAEQDFLRLANRHP
jgi:hypothetical protein